LTSQAWIERLRVWAALAVIVLHVSGFPFRAYVGTPTPCWLLANFWNSGTRWAVPAYVVLSGYLLLHPPRRESPLGFWRRRAARIGVPLLFWGALYALWNGARTLPEVMQAVLVRANAGYHLWFLYMLAVLYAATPLLRALLSRLGPKAAAAACAACFLVTLHVPGVPPLLRAESLPRWLELAAPYPGYFLLGGLLRRQGPGTRMLVPALAAAASLAVTVGGMALLARHHGSLASRAFQDAASPNVIVMAWSLCVLARNSGDHFPGARLQRFAPAVLGVYLVHPLVLGLLWKAGLSVEFFPCWFAVPAMSACVAILSLAIALALRRLPLLRRTV
jgi:surface polysaccharide O-acyltransferase-like enzyme